jgi:thiol-disulfide isomerase/thioredoxin
MRRNGLFAILLLSFLTTSTLATPQQHPQPLEQQLQAISQLIEKGDVESAFNAATEAQRSFSHDVVLSTRLIDSLSSQIDKLDKSKAMQIKLINVAIRTANGVEKSKLCDGKGEGEVAYRYMTAIGKLAEKLESRNEMIASQLYLSAGKIATHLKDNPGYPQSAIEILALPIMGQARAYAVRGEQQAAFQSMRDSFELGFNDFEALKEDPMLGKLDQELFVKTVDEHLKKYEDKTAQWASKAVAEFGQQRFDFDVEDIDSGQIAKSDFRGSVVVVDLWATWCPPCREGIPHFIDLADHFEDSAVKVVGISMDSPQDPESSLEKVRDFVEDSEINYPIGMGDERVKSQLSSEQKLPTTLFIDHKGFVRYSAEGFHNFYQLQAITNELLKETSPISSQNEGM